ncbi:putative aspartic peptidase domain-containing protein [Medicago truncatula]|uniref:Putative aspartic peptidase domain-containing protein n=1 Tax=Medicago truncatula TaxID=3880 RepID=A0A396JDB6_MEDTR|nr:putative aspartic peptidase domain-containing protein [Medicago truncatula]
MEGHHQDGRLQKLQLLLVDNLLVFDLASSKLSFSSSLLVHNASCS